jgi:hypothetical protein
MRDHRGDVLKKEGSNKEGATTFSTVPIQTVEHKEEPACGGLLVDLLARTEEADGAIDGQLSPRKPCHNQRFRQW